LPSKNQSFIQKNNRDKLIFNSTYLYAISTNSYGLALLEQPRP